MQKRKIQMIVYDGSRVGAFVSALLLALVFIGALPPEDRKVNEMLKVQQQNTVALIQRQAETLTARSIALSEELTQELEQVLSTRGKTFEEINNDPELIFELETAAYSCFFTYHIFFHPLPTTFISVQNVAINGFIPSAT